MKALDVTYERADDDVLGEADFAQVEKGESADEAVRVREKNGRVSDEEFSKKPERGLFCDGKAAVALYASKSAYDSFDSDGDSRRNQRKVRAKCSIGALRQFMCFDPKMIAVESNSYVARLFEKENFKGKSKYVDREKVLIGEDYDGQKYGSVLICERSSSSSSSSSSNSRGGRRNGKDIITVDNDDNNSNRNNNNNNNNNKCEKLEDALDLCVEETKGKKYTKLALKANTDADRFGFLGKGVKARKFRALSSENALMKQMNGEKRQETCFFKEVVSEIMRGCDVGESGSDEGLNELVRGGYIVGFKGVAMVKKVKPDTEECRGVDSNINNVTSSNKLSEDDENIDVEEREHQQISGIVSSSSSNNNNKNRFVAEKKLEFLVIEDITHGIQDASIVDVDVSGAPASICRYCSLDVKNFRHSDGITSGDRFFWKKEARCTSSRISDVFENVILKPANTDIDASTFADLLSKEVEKIVLLMQKQNFVEFTDSSILLAFGKCPKTGDAKVRARVIDFGHATWKPIISNDDRSSSDVVGTNNKKWTLSKSIDSKKFACGAEELLKRLQLIASKQQPPKRCVASCLSFCDAQKAEGAYSCRSRAKKDDAPIGEEKDKKCAWQFKPDH
jgi:hypothetical protein